MDLIANQPWLSKSQDELLDLLLNECPSDKHKNMICALLKSTTHISFSSYVGLIDVLRNHVEVIWQLSPQSTIFVSSNNKETTDSSQEVLNQLKSARWQSPSWSRNQFLTRYRDSMIHIQSHSDVVIVDDFIGSGRSMQKTISWFQSEIGKHFSASRIYVISIASCREGYRRVRGLINNCYVPAVIPKAISDLLQGQARDSATKLMTDLENKLAQKSAMNIDNYRFGYGRQEAVFVRDEGNTPNNVFPVFWWNKGAAVGRKTIMHRT